MSRASLESPIPLSDMESVLGWVDTYKLSRQTKKINRDFSDAVLLAEILSVHYPKLVEMHNYPPRNSQSLKLNNWMTLNRKVLKKLKLSLCCNTMEQLANCAPGVIERVLVMVRDKINRDEEANKTVKDAEQNVSSGGSYYEACGDDEHVLVVPVKLRVNGVLETIQQKVVNYESYLTVKEELKDAKDTTEILKQKVEHLDTLLKLKDERIEELQKQLDRKQTRRKEVEAFQNSLAIPFDSEPPTPTVNLYDNKVISQVKSNSVKMIESNSKLPRPEEVNTKIVLPLFDSKEHKSEEIKMKSVKSDEFNCKVMKLDESNSKIFKFEESKIPIPIVDLMKITSKPSITEVTVTEDQRKSVEKIKSDIFKEIEIVEQKSEWFFNDVEEFKDSVQDTAVVTVKEIIENESKDITNPIEYVQDFNYVN